MRAFLLILVSALAVLGCDGETPADAGPDAALDAGRDAGRRDAAPPMCEPECAEGEDCCRITDGTACFTLRDDPRHCGSCVTDCLATHRGDACRNGVCACGTAALGCQGTRESFCCPPRDTGGAPYCANLEQSPADCGECDRGCSPLEASHCDGGRCICGDERRGCEGTPEDRCCAAGVDIECVDTTRDRFHCGDCNVLCQGPERCENGSCTRGSETCDGGCELGDICCEGVCCSRAACFAGTCGVEPDGGVPHDGGVPEGGVPDGSVPDGSVPDGG
ncbi:MAG TPA: hypothetical protein RMH99_07105 [Sandaracinaceae bacterium LLY-WYZ-13_1]|nr:hypothetical protein [Sandaracinaceae bacterium LLY-WYZ-13_1]